MCGRYTQLLTWAELRRLMTLTSTPLEELPVRYNVAPTQEAPVVRAIEGGGREGVLMRWGLVPSWAADTKIASKLINARSETAATKPSFRAAMKKRRCLVPASGFFEWDKSGAKKQPWLIRVRGGEPFAMAGLWESWKGPAGQPLETFTILTTSANELVAPLHERMPVILPADAWEPWLDRAHPDAAAVQALMRPFAADAMERHAVSTAVNRVANDGPECIAPVG